jgi:biotin carboxylase
MALAMLASEHYALLWLVDSSVPAPRHLLALHAAMVRKLGSVVDLDGLSISQAADAIAHHEPSGVVTFQDGGMVRLAKVAAELGLPFHTPEVAERLVDKSVQRRALEVGGVRVPRYWAVPLEPDSTDTARLESRLSFPAVLKPRNGAGSKYVTLVRTAAELIDALTQRRTEGLTDPMLVEEYLPAAYSWTDDQFAPFVSVESYVSQGHISHVAITGRFKFAEPFRETGNFIPADLSPADSIAVCDLATNAATALGVKIGCLHTEIKLTPDGPRLIEVNGRLGGGIPQMLRRVANLDLFDVAFRLALGENLPSETILQTGGVSYRALIQPPMSATRILRFEGLDRAKNLPGVDAVIPNKGPGQEVDWRNGFAEYALSAEGTVANLDELRRLDRLLRQEMVVVYE